MQLVAVDPPFGAGSDGEVVEDGVVGVELEEVLHLLAGDGGVRLESVSLRDFADDVADGHFLVREGSQPVGQLLRSVVGRDHQFVTIGGALLGGNGSDDTFEHHDIGSLRIGERHFDLPADLGERALEQFEEWVVVSQHRLCRGSGLDGDARVNQAVGLGTRDR